MVTGVSLKTYNTFGIDAKATFFTKISSVEEVKEILRAKEATQKHLFLGGGSNVLFLEDFDGLVIKNEIEGIDIVRETEEFVYIKAGSGVVWHEFVHYCVNNNYGGVENLSLIPGTVGAAPMQNIGAYGVEIKDTFEELEALNINTLQLETFTLEACNFGYRESVFKHQAKGNYFIASVTFRLSKKPTLHLDYGAIRAVLAANNIETPTIKDISNAVIEIRESKLPNPKEIGNAGSFFKNPEIPTIQFEQLKTQFPDVPSYPVNHSTTKIPAGWLIEQAGWKGKQVGNVGVHKNQALVLVNYGNGKGREIKALAEKIQQSVEEKFGIVLHPEVNFI
jgi:UDP-N-acetylmuramate dehydrogenase